MRAQPLECLQVTVRFRLGQPPNQRFDAKLDFGQGVARGRYVQIANVPVFHLARPHREAPLQIQPLSCLPPELLACPSVTGLALSPVRGTQFLPYLGEGAG
jgi:hypothetical protein